MDRDRILKILFSLSLTFVLVGLFFRGIGWVGMRYHIKMEHPCPNLSELPPLNYIDKMLRVTVGFEWYEVVDKNTGTRFLVSFDHDYITGKEHIKIMDKTKRDKWIEISRGEYFERFIDEDKKGLSDSELIKLMRKDEIYELLKRK